MRKFKFVFSLYFLPMFYFTLAVSPNISGDRIGFVLLSVFIFLIPATNYIVAGTRSRISSTEKMRYTSLDFLSLLMLGGAIYIGWQINWQFNALQILYFAFVAGAYRKIFVPGEFQLMPGLVLGLLLYAVTYIGLNQYGFAQLLNLHNFPVILCCGLLVTPIFYMADNGSKSSGSIKTVSIILLAETLSFAIFFFVSYKWTYAGLFALALVPPALWLLKMHRSSEALENVDSRRFAILRLVYAISLTAFFIYFFLNSTQVLQAIRGGY